MTSRKILDSHKMLILLRHEVEAAEGRIIRTPKDFDVLRSHIYEKTGTYISTSTLKRIWGYMEGYATVRTHTLNILSQYIGQDSYEHFCLKYPDTYDTADSHSLSASRHSVTTEAPIEKVRRHKKRILASTFLMTACILLCICLFVPNKRQTKNTKESTYSRVLHAGETFTSYNEYLTLFKVSPSEHFWDVALPCLHGITIWSPEYHHPVWHNEGDSSRFMPTITEWYGPEEALQDSLTRQIASIRNANLYYYTKRNNELRITFMKNLIDTSYVFLGIYRTNLVQSDTTHIVWERIADKCDLRNLGSLDSLRNKINISNSISYLR